MVPTTVISHPRRRWISRSGPGCHQGARFAIRELHRTTDPAARTMVPTTAISLPAGDQISAAATAGRQDDGTDDGDLSSLPALVPHLSR